MRVTRVPLFAGLITLWALWALGAAGLAQAQTEATPDAALQREITDRLDRLMGSGSLWIRETPVAATVLIPQIYASRQFQPAWTSEKNVDDLISAIEASEAYGFNPDDFHLSQLLTLKTATDRAEASTADAAEFDILLTDALIRLGYMHFAGKVDPVALDSKWNFAQPLLDRDALELLNEAIDGEGDGALIAQLTLDHPLEDQLMDVLARYRAIAEAGGWPQVPEGPALKPGMSDPRVPILRQRLAATDDLQGGDLQSPAYDTAVEAAVTRFQARHGLEADGVVGPGTLAALNVPVKDRIDQIRINLERQRWVLRGVGQDFIVVNIAGFTTYLVRGGEEVWQTRSIVGSAYRKTPVFRDDIKFMEFNPTWTVPPGILGRSIIPAAKKDPGYLAANKFSLIDRNGRRVDPASVDWANVSARGFPYSVVQSPGDHNALGLVKFMFPNPYLVYLHDTASRGLFAKTERALSSGCVRVDQPFDLAERLLADKPGWDRGKIDEVVASGKTTRVHLEQPMPVLLLYWTAWADPGEPVQFRRDIYERDGPIRAALNSEFDPTDLNTEQ